MPYKKDSQTMDKLSAQKKLAILWFVLSGVLILLFIAFTFTKHFDNKASKGWEWLSQNILPILTLMMATFSSSIKEPSSKRTTVDRFHFSLAYGISIFYLTILYLTVLAAPIARLSIIDVLEQSKLYLVILQSIVSYVLGLFFFTRS
jgi:hypothetical protein